MQTAQIIPFRFETREVRTLLIDDQPWFVAADVSSALEYRDADKLTRLLDDDEKGTQIVGTLGGAQEMLVINESGLYSAILRSRKAEAKRFKKWVTAEVLPAIRKHGRYEDAGGKMDTLLGQTIGTDGFHVLGAIISGKVRALPTPAQRRAKHKLWAQVHAAFNVRSAEDIPAGQLDAARNFIAAYALEGEFLPKQEVPAPAQQLDIHYPADCLEGRRPGMRYPRNENTDFLDVSLLDLGESFSSPCEEILAKLGRAGYNVDGAWWEIHTYRNKMAQMRGLIANLQRGFESPQQYVIRKA